MFQLFGFAVLVVLALYGLHYLGWLPDNVAGHLPHSSVAEEMIDNIDMPFDTLSDPEKSFTERVTGQPNPNK